MHECRSIQSKPLIWSSSKPHQINAYFSQATKNQKGLIYVNLKTKSPMIFQRILWSKYLELKYASFCVTFSITQKLQKMYLAMLIHYLDLLYYSGKVTNMDWTKPVNIYKSNTDLTSSSIDVKMFIAMKPVIHVFSFKEVQFRLDNVWVSFPNRDLLQ